MSVNIPPKVGSLINKIGENMEDGDQIMCEVNGVKYQIIQKTAAVGKTDSAPQAAVASAPQSIVASVPPAAVASTSKNNRNELSPKNRLPRNQVILILLLGMSS